MSFDAKMVLRQSPGYYHYPAIAGDLVVFVSEDDLWSVPLSGGQARRLTTSAGAVSHPALSPDGKWVAFTGRDEGTTEIYVMPSAGGEPRRLTFLGARSSVVGFASPDRIVFSSDANSPFWRPSYLFSVDLQGGQPEQLKIGPAQHVSYSTGGGCVLGRNADDPARWKRYRGGTAGDLWIDRNGDGQFERLLQLDGNVSRPMWLGNRIYFISDHEGVGNLYSCTPTGRSLQRHTDHEDFYVRHPMTDGQTIVYHAGADIYAYSLTTKQTQLIEIEYAGPRAQRQRKFVDAEDYLHDFALHPQGHLLALTCRGQCFTMGNWEGPVAPVAPGRHGRRRLAQFLADGKRIAVVSDESGEERVEIHPANGRGKITRLSRWDVGRVLELAVSPVGDRLAVCNHRNELLVFDLKTNRSKKLDRSDWAHINGLCWSPDGRWLAYSFAFTQHTAEIRVCKPNAGKPRAVTRPVLQDACPSFDPDGKYLYFLSSRNPDPVFDNLHFDLGFPRGIKPYLVVLQAGQRSPLFVEPTPDDDKAPPFPGEKPQRKRKRPRVDIDFDGIEQRVVALPAPDGDYAQIIGLPGKVMYTSLPIRSALADDDDAAPRAAATLRCLDLETKRTDLLAHGLSELDVSMDRQTMVLRFGDRLRILEAGSKPDEAEESDQPGRRSGWVDLDRIRLEVQPAQEWRQMYTETWRLQRDHFWTQDMSKVDWQGVYKRYLPLVERVSSRGELSDLLWELQAELGTSHAYEFGGDHRAPPDYAVGQLGADFVHEKKSDTWKVASIAQGDSWISGARSPLAEPGVDVGVGDRVVTINGQRLSAELHPSKALLNLAGAEVRLGVMRRGSRQVRDITVKTLRSDKALRYRDWVESNRAWVHRHGKGQIGYVHVPDMGAQGYAEFHRYFLSEIDRQGLIVDVRFNGGGFVSELILEKLARRRLGYDHARWFKPTPYPRDSVAGPVVALTNEYAGSDGDIFCHSFKLLGLGPLIGKRTWGGVIGMWARHPLVDGSVTTQPEFSFWFEDVGWSVENYGTDPDIQVERPPQEFATGTDSQLQRALTEAMKRLKDKPGTLPEPGPRPDRSVPPLPKV